MNAGTTYSLEDLEQRSELPARTIRSWIQEGLLPPAHGKARGAYYVQEHLDRLRILKRVSDELGYKRVPLGVLKEILRALEAHGDPDLIRRVAEGEERLVPILATFAPPGPQAAMLVHKAIVNERSSGDDRGDEPPIRSARARAAPARADERAGWTTIEIQDGLELRLRCDEPERVAWLARLARKLREWIREDGG